jgi:hypothetical protein
MTAMTLDNMILCETFVILLYVVYILHSETFAEINDTSLYIHVYVFMSVERQVYLHVVKYM